MSWDHYCKQLSPFLNEICYEVDVYDGSAADFALMLD